MRKVIDLVYMLPMLHRKRRLVCRPPAWACFTFLLITLGSATAGYARERGPRVEVVCLSPPIPVRIDTRTVLVYELHVTNFDVVPLTLRRLEIFANEENSEPLGILEDDTLSAAMTRVGATMMMAGSGGEPRDARVIEPGKRSVIFMWIELPSGRAMPGTLRHRMVFSAAAAEGGNQTDTTLDDFQVPVNHAGVPILNPPFDGGTWLAGSGPSNNSDHRRTITAIDGHIYSAERFAIDWVKVGPNGDSRHDGTTRNENWWGWGEPVLAVADSEITGVVDGIPDNTPRVLPPVTLDNIAGNHVIRKIAPNRYVTYAHLQNRTVKVRLHDHVRRGAVLALLGNSGNTTGAHLHLQVTDRNSVLQAEGVPFIFGHFTYLGLGSDCEINKHPSIPWSNSIPPDNTVVEFNPATKQSH
jgi:murein DD-endopeptidase